MTDFRAAHDYPSALDRILGELVPKSIARATKVAMVTRRAEQNILTTVLFNRKLRQNENHSSVVTALIKEEPEKLCSVLHDFRSRVTHVLQWTIGRTLFPLEFIPLNGIIYIIPPPFIVGATGSSKVLSDHRVMDELRGNAEELLRDLDIDDLHGRFFNEITSRFRYSHTNPDRINISISVLTFIDHTRSNVQHVGHAPSSASGAAEVPYNAASADQRHGPLSPLSGASAIELPVALSPRLTESPVAPLPSPTGSHASMASSPCLAESHAPAAPSLCPAVSHALVTPSPSPINSPRGNASMDNDSVAASAHVALHVAASSSGSSLDSSLLHLSMAELENAGLGDESDYHQNHLDLTVLGDSDDLCSQLFATGGAGMSPTDCGGGGGGGGGDGGYCDGSPLAMANDTGDLHSQPLALGDIGMHCTDGADGSSLRFTVLTPSDAGDEGDSAAAFTNSPRPASFDGTLKKYFPTNPQSWEKPSAQLIALLELSFNVDNLSLF